MTVHRFGESLRKSHKWADAPWWAEVYEKFFPDCLVQDMRKDGWWQRAGIDRRIHLPNATTATVDEKVREEDWPDFALEAFSEWDPDKGKRVPGWMDTSACDYLAYAFIPSRTCYLLPMRDLQRTWTNNRSTWWQAAGDRRDGFRFADAKNVSWSGFQYTTRSVCVPKQVVFDSLTASMSMTWSSGWGGAAA